MRLNIFAERVCGDVGTEGGCLEKVVPRVGAYHYARAHLRVMRVRAGDYLFKTGGFGSKVSTSKM